MISGQLISFEGISSIPGIFQALVMKFPIPIPSWITGSQKKGEHLASNLVNKIKDFLLNGCNTVWLVSEKILGLIDFLAGKNPSFQKNGGIRSCEILLSGKMQQQRLEHAVALSRIPNLTGFIGFLWPVLLILYGDDWTIGIWYHYVLVVYSPHTSWRLQW